MKSQLIRLILIVGAFLPTTVCRGAYADAAVFQNLSNCLDVVGTSLPKGGDWGNLNKLWLKMNDEISTLQNATKDHSLPPSYKESISNAATMLIHLAKDNKEHPFFWWREAVDRTEEACSRVENDLRIKVKFASQKPNDPFGIILVTVKTLQNQQEAAGCEVWYVGIGWEDLSDMYRRFPNLSSPTKKFLPPGYYAMWTKIGDKLSDRETITIDNTTETVELDTP